MAEYLIQDTTLDAIADAINAKTGGSSAMTPAQMVTAIGSISGGGTTITKTCKYCDFEVGCAIVTVGANNIVGCIDASNYLLSLAGAPTGAYTLYVGIASEPFHTNAEFLTTVYSLNSGDSYFYRYETARGEAVQKTYVNSYDGKLNEGSRYLIAWASQSNWEVPT